VTEEQAPWRPSCGPPQTTTTEYSFADIEANEPITRNRTAAFEEIVSVFSTASRTLAMQTMVSARNVATICTRSVSNRAFNWSIIALLIGALSHGSRNKKAEFPIRNA